MGETRQEIDETTPLGRLKKAVKAAGGPTAVARRAKIPISHLGNVLCGTRDLAKETAIKLRPHVRLDAKTWVELLAPIEARPAADEAQAG